MRLIRRWQQTARARQTRQVPTSLASRAPGGADPQWQGSQRTDQLPRSATFGEGEGGAEDQEVPKYVSARGDDHVQVSDESVDSYLDCYGWFFPPPYLTLTGDNSDNG